MSWRVLAAVVCVAALVLGTAAATSLGGFQDVVLTAEARSEQACHLLDPSNDVTFYDEPLLGPLIEVALGLLDVTEPDWIELTNMSGDCVDVRPVVIVIGDHDGSTGTPDQVLSRTMLDAITVTDVTDVELLEVADGGELADLLNLDQLLVDPNEVRVGFCPVGQTRCEP